MQTISFQPAGDRIKASITFEGLIVASYTFTLWEAQSNNRLIHEMGNNQNPNDDDYLLPLPVGANDGRLIQLRSEFVGLDPQNSPTFQIKIALSQGEQAIGEAVDEGQITGQPQESLIYLVLKSA